MAFLNSLTSLFLLMQFLAAYASPLNQRWVVRRDVDVDLIEPLGFKPRDQSKQPKIYSMDIVSDIRLRYASTKVTSKVANPTNVAQEAVFHVVLPETAFISGFLMEIDGEVYKASVKEKEKAQEEYQAAVNAGQSAAQVSASARDANQFTVSVNIEAQGKVLFNLTYEELLTRRRGIYEQAIHVNPGTVVPRLSVVVNILEVLPIKEVKVPQLRGNNILEEEEANNTLARIIRNNETSVTVIYEPTETEQILKSKNGLEGQFVVQYDIDRTSIERKGGEIHVVDGYFVHFFAPSTLPTLPKHVVFVLDTSGSMAGIRLEQTKQAMVSILDQLRSTDVFSVVEFSTGVREWDLRKAYERPQQSYLWNEPAVNLNETVSETIEESFGPYDDILAYPATERTVKRAKEFVAKMSATESTNINDALLKALNNSQAVQSRIRLTPMIIFLTDGEPTVSVTSVDGILDNLRKANSDGVVSIFSLAFGTGADYTFLTKISGQNKGFARKIYEAADATLQLKGFFDEVASPLLSNVRFVYEGGPAVQNVTESKIAHYFKGSEFVVAGRVDPTSTLVAGINGDSASGPYLIDFIPIIPIETPADPAGNTTANKAPKFSLEKVWAYLTIKDLLKKREADIDAKAIEQINSKALRLSLKYEFVTPLTSLVVVKPNETAKATDVRPADGGSSPAYYQSAALAYPAPLAFPGSQLMALRPVSAVGGFAPASIGLTATTSFSPDFAVGGGIESAQFGIEEEVGTTVTPSPLYEPTEWIEFFGHNNTHASVINGNDTLNLLWQDELEDKEYDSCVPTYTKMNVPGFCKSIWKCNTITRDNFGPAYVDATAACVIDNKYLGICCASIDDDAATFATVDSTPSMPVPVSP